MVVNLEKIIGTSESVDENSIEYLNHKISETGWFAKQFLNLEKSLLEDKEGWMYKGDNKIIKSYYNTLHKLNMRNKVKKVFDFFYSYLFIGSLTGYDQELYCKIHGNSKTPAKITLINSALFGAIGAVEDFIKCYMLFSADKLNSHLNIPGNALGGILIGLSVIGTARNVYRIYQAAWGDKKGREPWGYLPVIINAPTYAKRLNKHIKQMKSNISSAYKNITD